MALAKGRNLLARSLRLLHSPLSSSQAGSLDTGPRLGGPQPSRGCSPAMRVAWALLRNVACLFGGHAAALASLQGNGSPPPSAQEVSRTRVDSASLSVRPITQQRWHSCMDTRVTWTLLHSNTVMPHHSM